MAVFFELKLYGTEINIQIIIDIGFHFIGERIFIIIIISSALFSTAISDRSFSVHPESGYEA